MKRILVGLDGSPHERRVLDVAADLAAKLDAKLILFHAVSLPVVLPPRALSVAPEEIAPMLADDARRHLEELRRTVPAARIDKIEVALGAPWRAVCDAAASDHADLVVVGSHGYGAIDRVLGTTAAKIVNHATCSVLIAR